VGLRPKQVVDGWMTASSSLRGSLLKRGFGRLREIRALACRHWSTLAALRSTAQHEHHDLRSTAQHEHSDGESWYGAGLCNGGMAAGGHTQLGP
jgi:hypothetical protein